MATDHAAHAGPAPAPGGVSNPVNRGIGGSGKAALPCLGLFEDAHGVSSPVAVSPTARSVHFDHSAALADLERRRTGARAGPEARAGAEHVSLIVTHAQGAGADVEPAVAIAVATLPRCRAPARPAVWGAADRVGPSRHRRADGRRQSATSATGPAMRAPAAHAEPGGPVLDGVELLDHERTSVRTTTRWPP